MTEELKSKIQKLRLEKKFEEIIKLCDEVIKKDDKDEDAYFFKGVSLLELKQYYDAICNFNKVIELNPNDEESYYNIGNCKFNLGNYAEAIKYFDKAIELNPNYEKAYLNRGISKVHLEMYKEALDDFDVSIKLNPNIDITYFEKAHVLLELKKYEEAIINLNKSIALNNNYEEAYFFRGIAKSHLEIYKDSIEDFDKAIELNPNYEGAYFTRGLSKIYLKMYDEAIEDYNKVIKLNPYNEKAYFNRGVIKSDLGKYKEALKDIDKAIKLNPNEEKIYFVGGIFKLDLTEYKKAINYFNKAIELNPNNEEAYFLRAICKIYLKTKNAIEDIRCLFKINQDNNIYIITILQLFGEYSNFEEYNNIEKLFKFIVDVKNNELWENEPITNLIFSFNESIYSHNNLTKNIKYLLLYEYFLLKILTFDIEENNNIEISHYTSLDILPLLLNVNKNIKESGKIRINNITTANDPKEGKILESIFNKNNIDIKIESDEKALTLQTSYSRNKDSLTMFRLYGKKENKEATGICLVLNNEYFNNSYTSPYSYEFKLKTENNSKEKNKEEYNEKINEEKSEENKRNLYWVLYYNEKENQLIYNKEKSKYASNIIDLNDLVDNIELKEDDTKENMIKYAFAKIFHYTKEIKKQIEGNENYKNIKNQLYSYLFENIKYIIKHEAFFEEQELRMLVTNDYKSDEILIDNDKKKLYIDYIKLFDERTNYIKEIIIGSKVENNEAVAEYIRKVLHTKNTEMNKLDDIKVSISEAPLR